MGYKVILDETRTNPSLEEFRSDLRLYIQQVLEMSAATLDLFADCAESLRMQRREVLRELDNNPGRGFWCIETDAPDLVEIALPNRCVLVLRLERAN